ncbi:hypothetical protein FGG08_000744 [Glutinoglossum americanum]|uniref:Kinetochore protein n=1 Tax=Glutinoglossum americanum TaxID=1670608 RepID=A0A9P8I9K8_9PEZI|nr:hypothetical protein FGG08_000744 [Glutinoglossum americanum]
MSLEETVITLKKRFVASQVRLLNGTLRPSRDWRENAPRTEHGDLSERAVGEALYKLNSLAHHHNTTAYSSHAQRHVAEQIEALYWSAGEIDRAIMIDDALDRGVDLRQPEYAHRIEYRHMTILTRNAYRNIARLPDQWPDEEGEENDDLERYEELYDSLTSLSEQIQRQRQKVTQFNQLKQLLKPFENPQESIQPNIVTRDGELGKELDKMRILMARVAGRVGELKGGSNRTNGEDTEVKDETSRDRLQGILGA